MCFCIWVSGHTGEMFHATNKALSPCHLPAAPGLQLRDWLNLPNFPVVEITESLILSVPLRKKEMRVMSRADVCPYKWDSPLDTHTPLTVPFFPPNPD